jgi:ubiquinone biosynthesis protein Coq4
MDLLRPSPTQAAAGLRALKMVVSAEGVMGPAARALLDAAQRRFLRTSYDLDALAPIAPEELAAAIGDAALARQFVQAMTVACLTDGPPGEGALAVMDGFARALGVESPELEVIRKLAEHHLFLFRLDFLRRSHLSDMAKDQLARSGVIGTLKGFAGLRGLYEDPALAARYRALGDLPEGTLGRAYYDYAKRNGFAFPGEKNGFPEAGVYHDLTHVLSGYGTDSPGEVQVAGFVAGYRKHNPAFVLLFIMLTFGAGINVTPLEQPHTVGILAQEDLADRFFEALLRGTQVNTDLSDGWDYWPFLDRPLDEVRRALNVLPLPS